MRGPIHLTAGLVLGLLVSSCSGAPPARGRALLAITAVPDTASVYVDDRYIASARRLAIRPEVLRVGVHHVTITAPEYFPHDVELALPEGLTSVRISLRPIPP